MLAYKTASPDEPPTTLLTFADATCTVTMHPSLPLLAVATGERRYPLPGGDGSDDAEDAEAEQCTNSLSLWLMPSATADGATDDSR